MKYSSQVSLRMATIAALALTACAKGGTTLDEEAAQSASPNATASPSSSGSSGAGGGAGASAGSAATPCGNGRIDDGEDCDGAALGGVTCVNLGFSGGQLACDPMTCVYETSMCTGANTGGGGNGG